MKDWLALTALIPAMTGPLPAALPMLEMRLCGGGMARVPLPRDRPGLPCQQKGCHASCELRRFDPAQ